MKPDRQPHHRLTEMRIHRIWDTVPTRVVSAIGLITIAMSPIAAQRTPGAPLKPSARIERDLTATKGDTAATPVSSYPRPTNITAAVYRGSDAQIVDFRWGGAAGAASVGLLRSSSPTGTYNALANVSYADHWARDNTGQVGQTMYYKLVATYSGAGPIGTGTGAGISDPIKVFIPPPPSGISNLQGSSPGSGKVILNWVGDPEATGYSIWRWNGTNRETMIDVGSSPTTFADSGLAAGVTFRYAVFTRYADPNTSMETDVNVTVH